MTGLRHHYTGEKANIPFYNDYDVLYMVIAKRRTVWGELVVVNLPFPKISAFFESLNFIDRTISFTDLKTSKKMLWANHCYNKLFEPMVLSNGKTLKLWKTTYVLKASKEYVLLTKEPQGRYFVKVLRWNRRQPHCPPKAKGRLIRTCPIHRKHIKMSVHNSNPL